MSEDSLKNTANYFNEKPISIYMSIFPSLIFFLVFIIFTALIYVYRKNSLVYVRTIVLPLLFIASLLSLAFNIAIFNLKYINNHNKNISKINLIILSIVTLGSLLYLILSHTFGCL